MKSDLTYFQISRITEISIRLARATALLLVWAKSPKVGVTPGAWKPPLPAAPFAVSAGGSGTCAWGGWPSLFYFPFSWEFHHPNSRTPILQRGGSSTNQSGMFMDFPFMYSLAN